MTKSSQNSSPSPDFSAKPYASFNEARTPVERAVFGVWKTILNRDQIGIQEDFFQLGGTRELAEQVAEQIREIFLLDVSTSSLFHLPTVIGQAAYIEDERTGSRSSSHTIARAVRRQNYPLSFAQERLWFFDRLVPNSPLYNNTLSAEILGPFDLPALTRSLNEVVRRHESLRTVFADEAGQAFQSIAPEMEVSVPCIDLSSLDPISRQAEVSRLKGEEAQQPFDLARGPLFRARILKLGPDFTVLLLNIHHIISDGWSLGILLHELGFFYSLFHSGQASPLPDPPIQYVDFTGWQRRRLQGELLEKVLGYWREKLRGCPPVLNLKTDRPRLPSLTFCGASQSFLLEKQQLGKLKELSNHLGVTVFMVLLAAFGIVLFENSGQEDFCIGTPIANRNRVELEGLIGLFINMLALRVNLNGEQAFDNFVKQIRQTTLEAYNHQDIPFELLVEKLRPARITNRTPFFQVMFIFANFKVPSLQLPGLDVELAEIDTHTAKFDLSLYLIEQGGGDLVCKWEYNTDLFNANTITKMNHLFLTLLDRIAQDPGQRISSMLTKHFSEPGGQQSRILSHPPGETANPGDDREDFRL